MLLRVGIAATLGALAGAYVEPHVTPHLPASIASNPTAGKFIHAGIGGLSAALIYWAIAKEVK